MVSEGVDIPRLAVGVYATSASTPLYQAEFTDDSAAGGPMSAGPPERMYLDIEIHAIDFDRPDESFDITFTGSLDSSYSMSVVQDSADGIGPDDFQGDANISGHFALLATWDMPASGAPDLVDCDDTTWDVEGYIVRYCSACSADIDTGGMATNQQPHPRP
jgi:hypothetical protein